MKTLLVIAKEPALAAAVNSVLDPNEYRVLPQEQVWQAEIILTQGVVDLCLLDAELTDVQPIRIIKHIRRLSPNCPILIYTSTKQWEWEEEAYLLGVEHILTKPVRARLLNSLLERLCANESKSPTPRFQAPPPVMEHRVQPLVYSDTSRGADRALQVLRDFSAILTHSLCSESLLKEVLLLLRGILGVNRAAIFLRRPVSPEAGAAGKWEDPLLKPACALGLPADLLEHLVLSIESGIGGYLYRSGRILKNGSDEARADLQAQKEFTALGTQVAIPILDRESLVGVAIFDGRLTGEFFANEELALIFHLLEGVGLALKNSWLHDQLSASHEMMTDVLDELESGCVVVDRQLKVRHANPAARAYFLPAERRGGALEFRDLPQQIGSTVFQVLETGVAQPAFQYRPDPAAETVYRVRITAFQTPNAITANAVLLLVDDVTNQQRVHKLEIEAANLRLIKSMASQLAHEIGNSMVPIFTYQELSTKKHSDPAFRAAIIQAAAEGVRRISRLTKQMQVLADDALGPLSECPVPQLIGQAINEAETHSHNKTRCAQLESNNGDPPLTLRCDSNKLTHALSEIILNALQVSPNGVPVQVRWHPEQHAAGGAHLTIEIEDSGGGFTPQAAQRAVEPFFSTRIVGIGLGLTVVQRIVELHHGQIEISPAASGKLNVVRVCLPLSGGGKS